MIYKMIYSNPEADRVMTGVILDARYKISGLDNLNGFEVKEYIEEQKKLVSASALLYKIETYSGTVVGYVIMAVGIGDGTCVVAALQLRPAFENFISEITQKINTFITEGKWKNDILL